VVSRLLAYKRVDLAVQAATRLGLPLDVIGAGPERGALERTAGPTVQFHGWQPDPVVREAMRSCAALLVSGAEDFGLTVVEAQASGRPPIALAAGGALETVQDGITGFLFAGQTVDSIARAMAVALECELSPAALRASAERFDLPLFAERLRSLIDDEAERKARQAAAPLAAAAAGGPEAA
jgi:glycosyltransferase involved in cell wall biosynthesis